MALIIETGQQEANANSFVTDLEYTTYATAKGLTVAALAADRAIDLISAIDYQVSLEPGLQGNRTSSTQSTFYPRRGVELHGYALATDKIPNELKYAQMEAAAYSTNNSLLNNTVSSNTQSESVDTLSVTYFKGGKQANVNLQRVNAYMLPLMSDANKLVRT